MIVGTVSFMVAPGKNYEAQEYFQQAVREFKKVTGNEARVLSQLGGPVGHYLLSAQYDSIAAWDTSRTKLQADNGFQKLLVEAGKNGLFIPGTTTSSIWQQV